MGRQVSEIIDTNDTRGACFGTPQEEKCGGGEKIINILYFLASGTVFSFGK